MSNSAIINGQESITCGIAEACFRESIASKLPIEIPGLNITILPPVEEPPVYLSNDGPLHIVYSLAGEFFRESIASKLPIEIPGLNITILPPAEEPPQSCKDNL